MAHLPNAFLQPIVARSQNTRAGLAFLGQFHLFSPRFNDVCFIFFHQKTLLTAGRISGAGMAAFFSKIHHCGEHVA
ncbi:MAG: hypothetical protein NZM41_04045 [Saprospiraceae bacterium]|nr:hypothetical protein [Saprospiraceae bacterium]